MPTLTEAYPSVTGGCLCGEVRYAIERPAGSEWPPDVRIPALCFSILSPSCRIVSYDNNIAEENLQAHTCQCTQCRKQAGTLVVHFITVPPSQLKWESPSPPNFQLPDVPFQEFSSSAQGRRGFCTKCGSALTWRNVEQPEELELFVGTIDEIFLIGDRTSRVTSESLARPGKWTNVKQSEHEDGRTRLGQDLCIPKGGNFFVRNAVAGVTDQPVEGVQYVEDTKKGLVIRG